MASKKRKGKSAKPPKRRKPSPPASRDPDRLKRRVSRVRPLAWADETPEDVAVFDDTVLARLAPEVAAEVSLVRQSLELVSDSFGNEANNQLASISRRSPMSEWRLFIRGLVHWYENRIDDARESWNRLDTQRRPSRIARALIASERSDLQTHLDAASTSTLGQEAQSLGWDNEILSAAKLVRQVRVDRPAIVEAIRETSRRERMPAELASLCLLGPERLDWVIEFCAEHRQLEPQLVKAIEQAALDRVTKQPFDDLHQLATAKLSGPTHDPKHLLNQSFYHRKFSGGEVRSASFMEQYLTKSLPNNTQISSQLKAAIQCELFLEEARREAQPAPNLGIFSRFMSPPVNDKQVAKLYLKALAVYPAHTVAHREYVEWILEHLDSENKRNSQRETFEALLLPAMRAWSEGLPDEIEPRLWLVDHYLENEELEAAQPHVKWLSGSRHADPRVRATPWKWELLEAMRMCRRKSWVAGAIDRLDAAERIWPNWLSKDWLPYFRAAILLRQGELDSFNTARREIRSQREASGRPVDKLSDAVMMLGAAQHMRVPAADLKTLRAPVDEAVKQVDQLEDAELIHAASFFWDMHRSNLAYPAYRMHGGKFAKELFDRFKSLRKGDFNGLMERSEFRDAVFWLAERRSFGDGYEYKPPVNLLRQATDLTKSVVAVASILRNNSFSRFRLRDHLSDIEFLRKAAAMEQDPYYRFWFGSLAERADAAVAASAARNAGLNSFDPFGWMDNDDDDDEEDDEEDDDYECDCPACRAERGEIVVGAMDDEDDFTPNIEPPKPSMPRIDPASDPDFKRNRPKDPMGKQRKKNRR